MASTPTVRWSESAGRWMAWVSFPDGARRKVERVEKAAAQRDLDELLSLRAQALEPPARRQQAASFAQVIDAWLDAGCPAFVYRPGAETERQNAGTAGLDPTGVRLPAWSGKGTPVSLGRRFQRGIA
ncbi:MAG: hypothetical protein QOI86_4530 [Actinomycetota bacterium]|nr:hypothetical protein [Actinomycetota bacterium]